MGRKKSKSKLKRPTNTKQVWRVKAPSTSAPPPPPWVELPRDVTANILQRLDLVDILESVQKVCTTWRSVCRDPAMWRVIDIRNDGYLQDKFDLNTMCCHAVDRSQGQLRDITLEYFGDDELLDYICQRSSHLKRLLLACCCDMTSKGLSEALKKTPLLEELHLNMIASVFPQEIETIGISCPMLKSFSFTERSRKFPFSYDSEDNEDLLMEGEARNAFVLAVAKTMPNLRHLGLFGSAMNNVGLKAILDDCPHLESLDIRQCLSVDLGGDLGKRLSQQIKNLRRPTDSTDDYVWDSCESYKDDCYTSELSDFYEDYTNPFSSEYLSDDDDWFMTVIDYDHF
ncbi:hypothetical protein BUALT_Bualt03G0021100 [Buddleja alternifolia]|uniref:F-box domain-containing protein n=1 Tax=Buddleja alternifolia TaxID=168488 RepID=A0AAV6XQE7_9LAMI|nr:hypothetical protein BUALT_Bualt03G0021100 [Buddleja alternifolia]